MKRITLTALLILVVYPVSLFAGGAGTTAAEFLKFDVGARPIAMGGAYAAVSDDANALNYNPSGLMQIDRQEVGITHVESFMGIRSEFLGYVHPLDENSCIGGAITTFSSGSMDEYDATGALTGNTVSGGAFSPSVSYARKIDDQISVGSSLRLIMASLADESAFSFALDIGGMYKLDDMITIGAVIQNFGPAMKYESAAAATALPINLRVGATMVPLSSKPLMLAGDIVLAAGDAINFHLGAEYLLEDMYAFRVGFRSRTMGELGFFSGLTLGVGISNKLGQSDMIYGVNYALITNGELGLAHRISLALKL